MKKAIILSAGQGSRLGHLTDDRPKCLIEFNGRSLTNPEATGWAVTQDEGRFDAITGATVTARAVVRAVHNTLRHFELHRDELLARARDAALARQAQGEQ